MPQVKTPRAGRGPVSGVPGLRVRSVVALAAALALAGCGSDSSPTGGGSAGISASMNGTAWSASSASAQHNAAANLLVIFALPAGSQQYGMSINISGFQGTGTHTFGPGNQALAVVTVGAEQGWNTVQAQGSGSVTVTSFSSSRVTGTFSFTAHPSLTSSQTGPMVVTNGQFDLPVIPVGS